MAKSVRYALDTQQKERGQRRSNDGACVIHGAVEAEDLPTRRGRGPCREHCVARRAANAFADPVEHANTEYVRPRLRHRDERPNERRHAVSGQDERPPRPCPVGSLPGKYLDQAVCRLGGALHETDRDGAGAEDLRQEEREERIDGFGCGIGRQTDPAQEPDRTRQIEKAAIRTRHARLHHSGGPSTPTAWTVAEGARVP